jgi:transcriptional regulator with XRE-family HTH domain
MNDYLDELVNENCKNPQFAAKWTEVEARVALALLRKEANLTQEEVAQRMGVARPRVAELENRPLSVSFGRILAYANALGISIEKIADRIGVLPAGTK